MHNPLPNVFRRRMLARERLIGCWLSLANPLTAEIAGQAGFDWLLIDGEHAPNDITSFLHQLHALQGSDSAAVVRPASNDPVLIKRLLDLGFYNLLIPFVESADQARAAVAATRYPPHGMRGVSVAQRSNRYGAVPGYFDQIDENICVLVQIENQAGIDAVDAIAAVPGVDGVFIGPSDLAAALGHLGDPAHPVVQDAIAHLCARAGQAGKAVGILAPQAEFARRYLDMGMGFVAVGSDLGVFRQGMQALRDSWR